MQTVGRVVVDIVGSAQVEGLLYNNNRMCVPTTGHVAYIFMWSCFHEATRTLGGCYPHVAITESVCEWLAAANVVV